MVGPRFYILHGTEIVEVDTVEEWARFFEDTTRRRVGDDLIDGLHVSTVFMGIDHNVLRDGPPVLFETMIFDAGGDALYQTRCCTYTEATEMHAIAVEWVKSRRVQVH